MPKLLEMAPQILSDRLVPGLNAPAISIIRLPISSGSILLRVENLPFVPFVVVDTKLPQVKTGGSLNR